MARSKNGEAISVFRRTGEQLRALDTFLADAAARGDLDTWRRARAIRRYIDGRKVTAIMAEIDVGRSTINTWLRWYETAGVDGLKPRKAPGAAPKLDAAQREELTRIIEGGPLDAGFTSGVWTGPMVGQLIRNRYGVSYHNHHVPRLLHQLGFSVQRPRKRLSRADLEAQATWLRDRLPEIKKKPQQTGA